MAYDIIGDIHGCAKTLAKLLEQKLGYCCTNGVYRHDARKVIFLGDFIDRNTDQRGVIQIVRPMIEAGVALTVMGNHEFNAIAYATPTRDGSSFLRPHTKKNKKQHCAFLKAYEPDSADYLDLIEWFKSFPLWLELDGLRVVHACWDEQWMSKIRDSYNDNMLINDLIYRSSDPDAWEYIAVETLLKGKEVPLPPDKSFKDKDGNERNHIRIRWWDSSAATYREAFMGPSSAVTQIPEDKLNVDHLIEYSRQALPVFLGHYWMEGEPNLLANNIACLDYSVAKSGGKLAAYRWDGERQLSNEKFVWVNRVD